MPRQIGWGREDILLYELQKALALIRSSSGGGGGAVDSVNGQTGVVSLDTGDIASILDSRYVTDAQLTSIGTIADKITGPVSSEANTIPIFSGITGKIISDSGLTIPEAVISYQKSPFSSISAALGNTVKYESYGRSLADITTTGALADGTMRIAVFYVTESTTLTGFIWWQTVLGDYVSDNYNGGALCSFSGGTCTVVASSTNDGNIWKAAANTIGTKAFSSPYVAAPGLYVFAMLYNSSSQTTAPSIGTYSNLQNLALASAGLTAGNKISGILTAQTSIPSSFAMSSLTGNNVLPYIGLY